MTTRLLFSSASLPASMWNMFSIVTKSLAVINVASLSFQYSLEAKEAQEKALNPGLSP